MVGNSIQPQHRYRNRKAADASMHEYAALYIGANAFTPVKDDEEFETHFKQFLIKLYNPLVNSELECSTLISSNYDFTTELYKEQVKTIIDGIANLYISAFPALGAELSTIKERFSQTILHRLFNKDEFPQTPELFVDLKYSLEKILFLLPQIAQTHLVSARTHLNFLHEKIAFCGPGAYTSILELATWIDNNKSLDAALGKLRKKIISDMIDHYIFPAEKIKGCTKEELEALKPDIPVGLQIHANILYYQFANEYQWHIPGTAAYMHLKDPYEHMLNLTEAKKNAIKTQAAKDFYMQYTDATILEELLTVGLPWFENSLRPYDVDNPDKKSIIGPDANTVFETLISPLQELPIFDDEKYLVTNMPAAAEEEGAESDGSVSTVYLSQDFFQNLRTLFLEYLYLQGYLLHTSLIDNLSEVLPNELLIILAKNMFTLKDLYQLQEHKEDISYLIRTYYLTTDKVEKILEALATKDKSSILKNIRALSQAKYSSALPSNITILIKLLGSPNLDFTQSNKEVAEHAKILNIPAILWPLLDKQFASFLLNLPAGWGAGWGQYVVDVEWIFSLRSMYFQPLNTQATVKIQRKILPLSLYQQLATFIDPRNNSPVSRYARICSWMRTEFSVVIADDYHDLNNAKHRLIRVDKFYFPALLALLELRILPFYVLTDLPDTTINKLLLILKDCHTQVQRDGIKAFLRKVTGCKTKEEVPQIIDQLASNLSLNQAVSKCNKIKALSQIIMGMKTYKDGDKRWERILDFNLQLLYMLFAILKNASEDVGTGVVSFFYMLLAVDDIKLIEASIRILSNRHAIGFAMMRQYDINFSKVFLSDSVVASFVYMLEKIEFCSPYNTCSFLSPLLIKASQLNNDNEINDFFRAVGDRPGIYQLLMNFSDENKTHFFNLLQAEQDEVYLHRDELMQQASISGFSLEQWLTLDEAKKRKLAQKTPEISVCIEKLRLPYSKLLELTEQQMAELIQYKYSIEKLARYPSEFTLTAFFNWKEEWKKDLNSRCNAIILLREKLWKLPLDEFVELNKEQLVFVGKYFNQVLEIKRSNYFLRLTLGEISILKLEVIQALFENFPTSRIVRDAAETPQWFIPLIVKTVSYWVLHDPTNYSEHLNNFVKFIDNSLDTHMRMLSLRNKFMPENLIANLRFHINNGSELVEFLKQKRAKAFSALIHEIEQRYLKLEPLLYRYFTSEPDNIIASRELQHTQLYTRFIEFELKLSDILIATSQKAPQFFSVMLEDAVYLYNYFQDSITLGLQNNYKVLDELSNHLHDSIAILDQANDALKLLRNLRDNVADNDYKQDFINSIEHFIYELELAVKRRELIVVASVAEKAKAMKIYSMINNYHACLLAKPDKHGELTKVILERAGTCLDSARKTCLGDGIFDFDEQAQAYLAEQLSNLKIIGAYHTAADKITTQCQELISSFNVPGLDFKVVSKYLVLEMAILIKSSSPLAANKDLLVEHFNSYILQVEMFASFADALLNIPVELLATQKVLALELSAKEQLRMIISSVCAKYTSSSSFDYCMDLLGQGVQQLCKELNRKGLGNKNDKILFFKTPSSFITQLESIYEQYIDLAKNLNIAPVNEAQPLAIAGCRN